MVIEKKIIRKLNNPLSPMTSDNTETKVTALGEGEEHFRKLFEDHRAVKLVIDCETGNIIDANKAAVRFYGWPLDTLKQMSILQINTLPPAAVKASMEKVKLSEFNRFEFCHQTVDGSVREVEVSCTKIKISGKDFLYSIIHDITDRNRTEKALREMEISKREQEVLRNSETRFREVLENALDAAYKRSLYTDRFEYLSPVFARISGYTLEEMFTMSTASMSELIHPDDRTNIHRIKTESISSISPSSHQLEYRIRHKNGHYIWLQDYFTLFRDAESNHAFRIGSFRDITTRKQTEISLQEERSRLESIIQGTRIGTWEWNVQTGDLIINERWADMLGYTLEELTPGGTVRLWKILVHPDDQPHAIELLRCHFSGDLPHYECEYRMRHKDGHWIWTHTSGRVITRTHDGEPLMMYGAHTDISEYKRSEEALKKAHDLLERRVLERTAELLSANEKLQQEMEERRRAETSLRQSEERYRRITEGLTDYIYTVHVKDEMAISTTRNSACEMVTGYTSEEYATDPTLWMRIVVPEDRYLVIQNIKNTLAEKKSCPIEYRILHKNGQIRWVSNKLIQQFDSKGTLVAYDGVVKDITERKLTEEQLFNSKATLAMAIDGISEPLIMLDKELRIKRLNRAAKDYYGLIDFKQTIGKFCFEAFRGQASVCEGCEQPFSELRGYSGCFERKGVMNPDRIEQVIVDMVTDASGISEASIIRIKDITQERMMDRRLIQSEKLASLGLLIAGIAHEINNPNNFIYFNTPILRSYLQFLLPIVDEYVLTHPELQVFNRPYAVFREDCFKLLDNIEHGSTRINQIVGNLRDFVRERGKGERRRIDLKQVVEKSISICLGRIKKTVTTFETHIPEDLPPLFTDPLAIEQIVVNLLINAIQAAEKDDSWVKLKILKPSDPEGKVMIEVSDNGCGMDAETQRKIFDPFFTTKAVGVGTGLGLSISHRLVEELGGRIEVKSEKGKGSRFCLLLSTNKAEFTCKG